MAPSIVHLPNGQTLTVSPSFGGLYFKSNELNTHHNVFPPGWTIILHSEDEPSDHEEPSASAAAHSQLHPDHAPQRAEDHIPVLGSSKEQHIHRFKRPTLKNDHLFISSISNPSSHEFRPPTSPTRQIAMMLWATLWWYFHQPEPAPQLSTAASANTPDAGKPKGEWRININREGIFKSKHLLPKLERMGLIATEDSAVGMDIDDGVGRSGEGWNHMFVSRRAFWQLDPRIYLFTIAPAGGAPSPYPSMSPSGSRPASPNRASSALSMTTHHNDSTPGTPSHGPTSSGNIFWRASTPPGPFSSGSHLPTFYPPAPAQYKWTGNVRHPVRPKPPRQGETFYTRYIPSLGQYLSFRVASLSPKPILHRGPVSLPSPDHPAHNNGSSKPLPAQLTNLSLSDDAHPLPTTSLSDPELLQKWMNTPRVAHSWGETGPLAHQVDFLTQGLSSPHSFPVIGSFDGKPFGYFEIYYVKEDKLSAHMSGRDVGDWDRGLHVLVGEQEFRGEQRVRVWLSALVHYCWTADLRTERVVMEPRVDNEKLKTYCEQVGFWKEREVSFPHKQSNLMKIRRDSWEQPAL